MDGRIMRCGDINPCELPDNSEIAKRFIWSRVVSLFKVIFKIFVHHIVMKS